MPAPLTLTPPPAPDADAYGTLADLASVLGDVSGDALAARLTAAREATRTLDAQVWPGVPADAAQPLAFPRAGMPTAWPPELGTVLPRRLVRGWIELTRLIESGVDFGAPDETFGIKREKFETFETEYVQPAVGLPRPHPFARYPRLWAELGPLLNPADLNGDGVPDTPASPWTAWAATGTLRRLR